MVPALVEGFSRHHLDLVAHLRHDVETPVEHQLDAGKAPVQGFDHAHQSLLLRLFVEIAGQAVRVERVQEEAPVAALPQGGNHAAGKKVGPLGGRLVDNVRFPVAVACQLPVRGNVGVIRARCLHLGHGHVGVHLRAGQ
jgi:hypothetical protein